MRIIPKLHERGRKREAEGVAKLCFSSVSSFVRRADTETILSNTLDLCCITKAVICNLYWLQKKTVTEALPGNTTWEQTIKKRFLILHGKHILLCGIRLLPMCNHIDFPKCQFQPNTQIYHTCKRTVCSFFLNPLNKHHAKRSEVEKLYLPTNTAIKYAKYLSLI